MAQRTIQQNKALHVLFQLLADELNNAGLDMRKTLKPEVEIPWTPRNVKEFLWRPIQKAQLNKASTTELTTSEIDAKDCLFIITIKRNNKIIDNFKRILYEK